MPDDPETLDRLADHFLDIARSDAAAAIAILTRHPALLNHAGDRDTPYSTRQ